jgi:hypothetical protein
LRDEARNLYLEPYDCFFLSRFGDVHSACRNKALSHVCDTTPITPARPRAAAQSTFQHGAAGAHGGIPISWLEAAE